MPDSSARTTVVVGGMPGMDRAVSVLAGIERSWAAMIVSVSSSNTVTRAAASVADAFQMRRNSSDPSEPWPAAMVVMPTLAGSSDPVEITRTGTGRVETIALLTSPSEMTTMPASGNRAAADDARAKASVIAAAPLSWSIRSRRRPQRILVAGHRLDDPRLRPSGDDQHLAGRWHPLDQVPGFPLGASSRVGSPSLAPMLAETSMTTTVASPSAASAVRNGRANAATRASSASNWRKSSQFGRKRCQGWFASRSRATRSQSRVLEMISSCRRILSR